MAMSHICLPCGLDIGGVAPARDPIYGLLIVTCPRCRSRTVRRPFRSLPQVRAERAISALLWSGALLVANAAALLVLAVLMTFMVKELDVSLNAYSIGLGALLIDGVRPASYSAAVGDWITSHDWPIAVAFLFTSLTVGGYLRFGFSHWPWFSAWLAFAAIVLLFLLRSTLMAAAEAAAGSARGYPPLLVFAADAVPVLYALAAVIGIPVGNLALRIATMSRGIRWRNALRRARARRTA